MKLAILAALLAHASSAATFPDLSPYLDRASAAWGIHDPSVTIRYQRLNGCHVRLTRAFIAWSDFPSRAILINSACNWDKPNLLQVTVTHEYGHMLTGAQHSENKRSIMYPLVRTDQVITPEDRARINLSGKTSKTIGASGALY